MYETEAQHIVSDKITKDQESPVRVGISESELNVIVTVDGVSARYTADEARELANAIQGGIDQMSWKYNQEQVDYIRALSDVVDGYKDAEDVVHDRS